MTHEEIISKLVRELSEKEEGSCSYFGKHTVMVPSRIEVVEMLKRMQSLMFFEYFKNLIIGDVYNGKNDGCIGKA